MDTRTTLWYQITSIDEALLSDFKVFFLEPLMQELSIDLSTEFGQILTAKLLALVQLLETQIRKLSARKQDKGYSIKNATYYQPESFHEPLVNLYDELLNINAQYKDNIHSNICTNVITQFQTLLARMPLLVNDYQNPKRAPINKEKLHWQNILHDKIAPEFEKIKRILDIKIKLLETTQSELVLDTVEKRYQNNEKVKSGLLTEKDRLNSIIIDLKKTKHAAQLLEHAEQQLAGVTKKLQENSQELLATRQSNQNRENRLAALAKQKEELSSILKVVSTHQYYHCACEWYWYDYERREKKSYALPLYTLNSLLYGNNNKYMSKSLADLYLLPELQPHVEKIIDIVSLFPQQAIDRKNQLRQLTTERTEEIAQHIPKKMNEIGARMAIYTEFALRGDFAAISRLFFIYIDMKQYSFAMIFATLALTQPDPLYDLTRYHNFMRTPINSHFLWFNKNKDILTNKVREFLIDNAVQFWVKDITNATKNPFLGLLYIFHQLKDIKENFGPHNWSMIKKEIKEILYISIGSTLALSPKDMDSLLAVKNKELADYLAKRTAATQSTAAIISQLPTLPETTDTVVTPLLPLPHVPTEEPTVTEAAAAAARVVANDATGLYPAYLSNMKPG